MPRIMSLCLTVLLLSSAAIAAPVQVWSPLGSEWNRIYQEMTDEIFTPRTGIEVEIMTFPAEGMEQKYLLSAATGDVPEIGITGSLGPADLGVRGAVIDLKSHFGQDFEELRAQMYPGLMRSLEFRGTTFGLPMQINLYPAYYRTDIFSDMGLGMPTTWSELYTILPRLQAQRMNFALAWGLGSVAYCDMSMFIWQYGGDWYTEDRSASGLDTPEAIAGFKEYTELFLTHRIPLEEQRFMAFKDGRAPIMTAPNWEYGSLKWGAPELDGKWTVALAPGTPQADGSINHAVYIGGMTFAMFRGAKRTDDAWEWLKWFLSAETQSLLGQMVMKQIDGSLFFPSNIGALMEIPLPQEHLKVFMDQALQAVAPAYALSPESITHRFLHNAANKVVLQKADPEEAIREAAQQMNAELRRKQTEFARFINTTR